jgi:hypothetical protein
VLGLGQAGKLRALAGLGLLLNNPEPAGRPLNPGLFGLGLLAYFVKARPRPTKCPQMSIKRDQTVKNRLISSIARSSKFTQIGIFWFENRYTIWQPCRLVDAGTIINVAEYLTIPDTVTVSVR